MPFYLGILTAFILSDVGIAHPATWERCAEVKPSGLLDGCWLDIPMWY
ncbi:MAG: hypothetical protein ACTSRA_10445 [Promethearchaeota archaeon]